MNSTTLSKEISVTPNATAQEYAPFKLEFKAPDFQELLRVRFEKAGWTIRKHLNDAEFRIHEMQGRHVAFSMADENGKLAEFSGVLRHSGRRASAFFQLEGREDFFNANLAQIMAVEPLASPSA